MKEPTDMWVTQGSPYLLSCEADGFPLPTVILHRITNDGRQELSRGIKTTSFKFSSKVDKDKIVGRFICESSNEAARLEKEFKVHVHGQFFLSHLLD
jgi:hypothetical protein